MKTYEHGEQTRQANEKKYSGPAERDWVCSKPDNRADEAADHEQPGISCQLTPICNGGANAFPALLAVCSAMRLQRVHAARQRRDHFKAISLSYAYSFRDIA